MQAPEIPSDEQERLNVLYSISVLDTLPEDRYDRITRIAQKMFKVPVVLISLVDVDRQWFKARQGLEVSQYSRKISFCGHAILQDGIFCINDAKNDARFSDNPLVTGAPHICFYAGAPLKIKGFRVGTLCIIDSVPRVFEAHEFRVLRDLADIVQDEISHLRSSDGIVAINKHNKYLQTILNNALMGIITVSQQGYIQSINPAALQLFAYSKNEITGSLFAPLFMQPFKTTLERLFDQDIFSEILDSPQVMTAITSHNTAVPVRIAISKTTIENNVVFVILLEDISRQQELEELSKNQIRNLKLANDEMEAFSYSVSHDLRAPLRAIDGFTKALEEKPVDIEGQDYIRRVRGAVDKMRLLIDSLLRLSFISKCELMPVRVDLGLVVHEVIDEISSRFDESNTEIVVAENVNVIADANLISIALENMLDNAVKYTGQIPDSLIEFGEIELQGERVFFVRDNGIGFDMSKVNELFKPFQRLHTEKEYPGTGIGLTISERIIRRHNGRLWVESEPGKGAIFYFTLNLQDSGVVGFSQDKKEFTDDPVYI